MTFSPEIQHGTEVHFAIAAQEMVCGLGRGFSAGGDGRDFDSFRESADLHDEVAY